MNNALCYVMLFLWIRMPGMKSPDNVGFQPLWFDALGATLLVAGAIPLYRYVLSRKLTPPSAP
jgi:hypothetical protein